MIITKNKILPVFLIPICITLSAFYGWTGYVTLIGRSGFYGSQYYYYQLSRPQYYISNFILATLAAIFLICQIRSIFSRTKKVKRLYYGFVFFVLLVLIWETFLSVRFIGKA